MGGRAFDGPGFHLPAERRGVGLVFQDYALWPHLPVREQVAFGLRVRRVPEAQVQSDVRRWLELLRIDHLAHRHPHELSGGQKQRVAIARALCARPSLLLLDEPFSNLDAPLREALRDELGALYHTLGLTVLHVTHDRQEAMGSAQRILVIRDGCLRQSGSPETLYLHPEDISVARMLGPANLIPGRVQRQATGGVMTAGSLVAHVVSVACPGERGVLFFRPEAVRLHCAHPGPETRNVFAAHVLQTGWHSGGYRHRLGVHDWEIMAVGPTPAAVGSEVFVEIPREACRVLPDDEEPRAATA